MRLSKFFGAINDPSGISSIHCREGRQAAVASVAIGLSGRELCAAAGIQRQHGFLYDILQFAVTMAGMLNELHAHTRIPEISQVGGNRSYRFLVMLGAREEGADLVGHLD
jgi:hypothetical protein